MQKGTYPPTSRQRFQPSDRRVNNLLRSNRGHSPRHVNGERAREGDQALKVLAPWAWRAARGLLPQSWLLLREDQREKLELAGAPESVIQEECPPRPVFNQLQAHNINGQ